jgi:hypothetical protein
MASEIVITVQNVIQGEEAGQTPEVPNPKATKGDKPNPNSLFGAIDAQFLIRASSRIISSTGNNEVSAAISKVARYGFQTVRAFLPPNPIGIATLALTVGADALEKVTDDIRKRATSQNEVDNARIKAGLLDVRDARLKANWFSGRITFKRV